MYIMINIAYPSVYFQTYGCQMNVSDTEIAWSILQKNGYTRTNSITQVCIAEIICCANLHWWHS